MKKALAKRLETGDLRYYALMERQEVNFKKRIEHILARPFVILFHEPMLIAITLYHSASHLPCITYNLHLTSDIQKQFVYGCLYLLFAAYPIVFTQGHNMSPGVSGLMFLPIPIGGAIAVILVNITKL